MQPVKIDPSLTKKNTGFALIESLVAIVVMALGILGILGIQMRTLTDTQGGMRRAQAIRMAEDLGERLQSNPDALNNLSIYASDPSSSGNCASTACGSAALATYDIKEWLSTVENTLPGGSATIFVPQGGARQLGILIGWTENRYIADSAGASTAEKTALNAPLSVSGTDSTGTAVICPTGQICHIQYIQPIQRCAPWSVGGASLYCPS